MLRRASLDQTTQEAAKEKAFLGLHGAWAPMDPDVLALEMRGFDRPWWVVGGWAIEAATGYRRRHEDTDVSLLACDVPDFLEFMTPRWHVRWRTVDEPHSQLWLRANAASPWVVDIPLTPDIEGLWSNKVVPGQVAPVGAPVEGRSGFRRDVGGSGRAEARLAARSARDGCARSSLAGPPVVVGL